MTLVLFILGIIALMAVVADRVTDEIKENMGFDVLLNDTSNDADLAALEKEIASAPYALEVVAHTPAEAASQWQAETGEDVVELLGVNPFAAEIEVRVKPQWANTDSLRAIAAALEKQEFVERVSLQADMIDSVNSNISTIAIALSVVALALLFISFVLINNTVRLTVYARRFIIHTMKLVGAKPAFIRRPFIVNNVVQGVIAALIASLLVVLLWQYVASLDPIIENLVTTAQMVWIVVALVLAGMFICAIAALWASNKYISLSYDEMFA